MVRFEARNLAKREYLRDDSSQEAGSRSNAVHLQADTLQLAKLRSADIPLRPRMFIVGPNASGKSNVLDAIRFLSEIAAGGEASRPR